MTPQDTLLLYHFVLKWWYKLISVDISVAEFQTIIFRINKRLKFVVTVMSDSNLDETRMDDILKCGICSRELSDPRLLLCFHTFCRSCLEKEGENKQPGGMMPCPQCLKEFQIPDMRFEGIRKNSFIEKLIDVQHLIPMSESQALCEICSYESIDLAEGCSLAVKYCIECGQKLCGRCSKMHNRAKELKCPSLIRLLTSTKISMSMKLQRTWPRGFCDLHDNKPSEMYCYGCKAANCMICHMESHQGHKCASVDKVGNEFRGSVERIIDKIGCCSNDYKDKIGVLSEKTRLVEGRLKEM